MGLGWWWSPETAVPETTLVGRLEMEWAWARVIPWGVPHWGHLGRTARAGVGLGWGQSQEILHQDLHGRTAGAGSGTGLGLSGGILHLRLPWWDGWSWSGHGPGGVPMELKQCHSLIPPTLERVPTVPCPFSQSSRVNA